MATKRKKAAPTPQPEQVETEVNLKDAIKAALDKKKPAGGFPKPRDNQHKH
ncbi:MAG: hypothetical protein ABI854_00385 [Betaproteobacteria bacterium]